VTDKFHVDRLYVELYVVFVIVVSVLRILDHTYVDALYLHTNILSVLSDQVIGRFIALFAPKYVSYQA